MWISFPPSNNATIGANLIDNLRYVYLSKDLFHHNYYHILRGECMRKIPLFGSMLICFILIFTIIASSTIVEKTKTSDYSNGRALIATIYVEMDPESQQVQDILDNYHAVPRGFLTDITITIPDPNDEDGEWFMIAPLFRTLIGDWIGIGPFFEIITPTETTTVYIPILWGDVHYWPPGNEIHEEFIIDGWCPLISWEY